MKKLIPKHLLNDVNILQATTIYFVKQVFNTEELYFGEQANETLKCEVTCEGHGQVRLCLTNMSNRLQP